MAGTNSCATKRSCQIRSTGLLLAKIHNIAAASRAGCVIKCPSMSMTAGQPLTTPTFTFHHCAVFSSRFSLAYLLVKRVFSIFGGMHAVSLAGWPMIFFFQYYLPLEFDCIQSGLKPFTTVLLVLQQRTKYLWYVWSRWYVSPAYP